jgi:hypothetical protein
MNRTIDLRAIRWMVTALTLSAAPPAVAADNTVTTKIEPISGKPGSSISLTYIGSQTLQHGLQYEGSPVGGLSGIDFDAATKTYYALSDDRAEKGPVRFYGLQFDIDASAFHSAKIVSQTELRNQAGDWFAAKSADPESLRLTPDQSAILWSSEGDAKAGIAPFLWKSDLKGQFLKEFPLPEGFKPETTGHSGIRNNQAFEGIAVLPSGDVLLSLENALHQDGPAATLMTNSPVRITRFAAGGQQLRQFAYLVDPIKVSATTEPFWNDSGLSEILALDDDRFLALERGFASGSGFFAKLYVADSGKATDTSQLGSLQNSEEKIVPAEKTLLIDFTAQGLNPDNLEGMTFATGSDGTPVLVFVSDDNFSSEQITQFLAFKVNMHR